MGESLMESGSQEPSNDGASHGSQSSDGSASREPSQQSAGSWRESIPEELRSEKGWDKYKDLPSALKSLHHAEKRMGASVVIPNEKSSPEESSAFYEKLGVPKTHTDYKYSEPKLPDGITWEKDGLSKFAEVAHKLKLTPPQLQGVLDYYGESLGSKFQGLADAHKTGTDALKKDWGTDFDVRLAESHAALKAYDPQGEFKSLMREIGADNDPRAVRFLQRIGAETGEHAAIKGERQDAMTKEDAQRKVDEIQKADQAHPLYNKKDPKHADATKEYLDLLVLANS